MAKATSVRMSAFLLLTVVAALVQAEAGARGHDTTHTEVRTVSATTPSAPARRGFWYAIGDRPTEAEVDAAPATYGVVVLNAWETWALRRLKQLDPTVTVLMYKCLASTRDYADQYPGPGPTGVGHAEAEAVDPSWFAVDGHGSRIGWGPFPGHWQMAVWDEAYQRRWTDNVLGEVKAGGWDGVLADNDLATLRWYSASLLSGTGSPEATDARLRSGLDALVTRAGTALAANGKLLVPNVSDGRLFPGRWQAHSGFGGGMEENLAHWGTDPSAGFVWDWPESGWEAQTSELSGPGLSLAITRAAPTDRRSLRYGYASVLVRADGDAFWAPSTTPSGDYTVPESIPAMSWATGAPVTTGVRLSSGAWTRRYEGVFAAVNPTRQSVTVPVPRGFVDGTGKQVSSVTLGATSGVVLRRLR